VFHRMLTRGGPRPGTQRRH